MDFVKDHEELYNKINTLRTRLGKIARGRGLPSSCNWSVKMCKAWVRSQMT